MQAAYCSRFPHRAHPTPNPTQTLSHTHTHSRVANGHGSTLRGCRADGMRSKCGTRKHRSCGRSSCLCASGQRWRRAAAGPAACPPRPPPFHRPGHLQGARPGPTPPPGPSIQGGAHRTAPEEQHNRTQCPWRLHTMQDRPSVVLAPVRQPASSKSVRAPSQNACQKPTTSAHKLHRRMRAYIAGKQGKPERGEQIVACEVMCMCLGMSMSNTQGRRLLKC